MKNILILIQLTSHVISQDQPQSQEEVESNNYILKNLEPYENLRF